VHQQLFVADEVVVVLFYGEIVDDREAFDSSDRLNCNPLATLGFDLLTGDEIACLDPVR